MKQKRLFAPEEGATFWEKIANFFSGLKDSIRNFFQGFFDTLDKWYEPLGLPVTKFLQGLETVIQQGTFTGSLFDAVVAASKFTFDDVMLAWLREHLPEIIARWQGVPGTFDTVEQALISVLNRQINTPIPQRGDQLRSLGSEMAVSIAAGFEINDPNLRKKRDFDMLVQGSYNLMKAQEEQV